jgi:hypothetical protein
MSRTHKPSSRVMATSERRLTLRLVGPRVRLDRKRTRAELRAIAGGVVRGRSPAGTHRRGGD